MFDQMFIYKCQTWNNKTSPLSWIFSTRPAAPITALSIKVVDWGLLDLQDPVGWTLVVYRQL